MDNVVTTKFLKEEEFRRLRILQCQGKDYNKYTSFIFYLRDFEYESLDDLDNSILESLNQTQIAEFQLNIKILFENQLNEVVNRYRLEEIKDLTIQLSPIITDDFIKQAQLGREIYSYLKYFKISFYKGYNFMHLHNYFLAYLEVEKLEKLKDTITAL